MGLLIRGHTPQRPPYRTQERKASQSRWNRDRLSRPFIPFIDDDPARRLSRRNSSPDRLNALVKIRPFDLLALYRRWNEVRNDPATPADYDCFAIFDPAKNLPQIVLDLTHRRFFHVIHFDAH